MKVTYTELVVLKIEMSLNDARPKGIKFFICHLFIFVVFLINSVRCIVMQIVWLIELGRTFMAKF